MKYLSLICMFMSGSVFSSLFSGEASVRLKEFGKFEGQPVTLYTLRNEQGMVAQISDYGGVVVRLLAPDREGVWEDVVLGFDSFADYEADEGWYGAITGRNANRIAAGRFSIDGQDYQLSINNGPHNFHGGVKGFNKKLWRGQAKVVDGQPQLALTYVSPDGEEGFPGRLEVTTLYTLTADNALRIEYRATTDAPTICNLTHHSYWNIGGPSSESIMAQQLQLFCDAYTPIDEAMIPTGEIRAVASTPFDFRTAQAIGSRIDETNEQLKLGRGYDHNYVINGQAGELRPVARLYDPKSGRVMEMLSTDYGVQVYSGNWFDGSVVGRGHRSYTHRIALCLECQHLPDSLNQENFKSAILRPGEVYHKTTVYRFSTDS